MLPFEKRFLALTLAIAGSLLLAGLALALPDWREQALVGMAVTLPLSLVGVRDLFQTRHAVLRNYPIIGHLRFLLEDIRPEIRQYFFEDDKSATNAPSSISAPRTSSTSGPSAPTTMSMTATMNGCTTRSPRGPRPPRASAR